MQMRSTPRSRLFATAMASCLALVAVSAVGIQKTYGATKKPKLPPMPVCAFDFSSKYAPTAGEKVPYTLSYALCKSVKKLSLREVKPGSVTKIVVLKKPQPTHWVKGGPVWVQNVSWRTYFTRSLRLAFAKGLKTGQKVQQKFIFSASGYRPDVEVVTQTVYNP